MTESDKKDINAQLDDLAVQLLELMNEHIECKMNIERLIKTGCLDLAKSRYIMGNNNVSPLQFPTDDVIAQTTVESTTHDNKVTFHLNRFVPEVKKQASGQESEKNKVTPQDPIKWFGVLVPLNLRQGRAWFQKALDFSVQGANVAAEIHSCQNQYRSLLKIKNNVQISEVES